MKISLLHATRGTPDRANATRQAWLSRASDRSMIEHLWATQAGDTTSTALDPDSIVAVTDDPPAWASSSVANWNAAAALATGDLLVVIADDLTPPIGWDETLRVLLGNPNTASTLFCVYVADQLSNDGLLRHPIMSRALYQRRGFMFDPSYYGVFCDNDLTTWCQVNRVPVYRIVPHRLQFYHDHDMTGNSVTAQQNREEAYDWGHATYMEKWGAIIPRKVEQTHSVWIGPRLSRMERLTLKMLVAHGHNPTLWVDFDIFQDFDNVPAGVKVDLIPPSMLPAVPFAGIPHPSLPNGGIGSLAHWSDWFACYVLAMRPGALWCQLDIAPIKPIAAAENTFTTYAGGLSTCAFTLSRSVAWECFEKLTPLIKSGCVGRDWHDAMRTVQETVEASGVLITAFEVLDCGGLSSSPFNRPVARDGRPAMVHWSNATHGLSKDEPVPGSLYAELLEEFGA